MTKQLFRFTFLLVCLIFPLITMAQTVNLPDPNLRAAVEVALGKASGASITVDDMGTVTRLDARNANINDLTGLESATNLTHLNLGGNNITDLSPAAGLTDLAILGLAKNNISDISPLAGLTNLVGLNLEQNTFSDISPLADLTNLVGLNLEQNTFSDISPLAGLTNLKRLILRHSAISDILPLAGLTNLTDLDLTNNAISDISALSGLTALETLDLKGNPIQDPSPLCILHDRNPELALDIDISCDSDSLSLQNKIDDSEAVKAPSDAHTTKAARAPSAYVPPITMVSTQMMEDVIYLKDGSIIRGIIVEHIPNESVRIRIQGGSEMIFKMADILKFTKELPIQQPTQQNIRIERREPWIAFALSFFIVGAGQVYNKEYKKARNHWFFEIASIVLIILGGEDNTYVDNDGDDFLIILGYIGILTNHVVSIYSAVRSAQEFNERNQQRAGFSFLDDRLLLEPESSRDAQWVMLSFRF